MTTESDARLIAQDLADRLRSGKIDTRDGLLKAMDESCDGSQRVTWTHHAMEAVCQHGTAAYTDRFGENGLTSGGEINWSAIAFCILEEMAWEALEGLGVDPNEPFVCPCCGEAHEDKAEADECCGDEERREALQPIALAFARACPVAGARYDVRQVETPEERAANLLDCGYLALGDPQGYSSGEGGEVVATLYAERRGGEGDCEPPADYHDGRWPQLGGELWWEWQNAAVGHVYRMP